MTSTASEASHPDSDSERRTNSRGYGGLRVVFFESRMNSECGSLITRNGGVPIAAPSMREQPLEADANALAFAEQLLAGQVDILVLLTGVGTRYLVDALSKTVPREKLLEALAATTLVVRGPKPKAVLKELGLEADLEADAPNTWKEVLATLRNAPNLPPLSGARIVLQEYGVANEPLRRELADEGAEVSSVAIYRWTLPENLNPLRGAIDQILARTVDVLLFTSSNQVHNLLEVVRDQGREDEFRRAVAETVVGSIGPICSETLTDASFKPDFEAPRSKLGVLVRHGADVAAHALLPKRELLHKNRVRVTPFRDREGQKAQQKSSVFLDACRGLPTPYTPIWLMRQAGRYMQEYREMRTRTSFIDLCKTPELAAQATLDAAARIDVDAAILFSDILLIVEPMGLGLEYLQDGGPSISRIVRGADDVKRLQEVDARRDLPFVMETTRLLARELPASVPLIGFSGAPFTLASYMIEGGGSRNYIETKTLMYRDKGAWDAMMALVARAVGDYLAAQVEAGADAVQLFDSWVGCLSPQDYETYVLPHTAAAIAAIPKTVPIILFGTGTATLLELESRTGATVLGVDHSTPIGEACKRFPDFAIQGNLDPVTLFTSPAELRQQAARILNDVGDRPGHIFNLGHGILPGTPVDNVKALVDSVHELSSR